MPKIPPDGEPTLPPDGPHPLPVRFVLAAEDQARALAGMHRRVSSLEDAYLPIAAAHADAAQAKQRRDRMVEGITTTRTGRALIGLIVVGITILALTRAGWTPGEVTHLTVEAARVFRGECPPGVSGPPAPESEPWPPQDPMGPESPTDGPG